MGPAVERDHIAGPVGELVGAVTRAQSDEEERTNPMIRVEKGRHRQKWNEIGGGKKRVYVPDQLRQGGRKRKK